MNSGESTSATGKHEVVVKDYHGKLLNGPNDVWLRPDGGLYFTDPYYQAAVLEAGGPNKIKRPPIILRPIARRSPA